MNLANKINEISFEALGKIGKTGEVSFGKTSYNYSDYNRDILPVIIPLAKKHGVNIMFTTDFRTTDSGNIVEYLVLVVSSEDETMMSRSVLKPYSDIKQRGAEMTYLKRYMLVGMFNLNTELDLDGSIEEKKETLTKTDDEVVRELKEEIETIIKKAKDKKQMMNYLFTGAKHSSYDTEKDIASVSIKDKKILSQRIKAVKGARK